MIVLISRGAGRAGSSLLLHRSQTGLLSVVPHLTDVASRRTSGSCDCDGGGGGGGGVRLQSLRQGLVTVTGCRVCCVRHLHVTTADSQTAPEGTIDQVVSAHRRRESEAQFIVSLLWSNMDREEREPLGKNLRAGVGKG